LRRNRRDAAAAGGGPSNPGPQADQVTAMAGFGRENRRPSPLMSQAAGLVHDEDAFNLKQLVSLIPIPSG
jgi:hypothetical protein